MLKSVRFGSPFQVIRYSNSFYPRRNVHWLYLAYRVRLFWLLLLNHVLTPRLWRVIWVKFGGFHALLGFIQTRYANTLLPFELSQYTRISSTVICSPFLELSPLMRPFHVVKDTLQRGFRLLSKRVSTSLPEGFRKHEWGGVVEIIISFILCTTSLWLGWDSKVFSIVAGSMFSGACDPTEKTWF